MLETINTTIQCPKCSSSDCGEKFPKWLCNKCSSLFIVLHEYQQRVISSTKRFILAIAGIQSGKSEVGAKWIIKEFIHYWKEDGDYLIAAPTYKILQQSTMQKFLDEVSNKYGRFNKQDMVYLLKNGKRIFLRSTEDPNSLEAMTLRSAWLDEAGQMKKQVWINLQGRTGVYQGKILLTTTPYPDYWWLVTEIIEFWKQNNPDYEVVEFDSIANPSFPRVEYERARDTLDPRVFAMRYQGKFVKMSGLIYPDFGTANIQDCPDESKITTWIAGMDFGHNFAFVLIGRDKDATYWQVGEVYTQGELLKENAERIKKLLAGRQLFAVYADPSEPGLMQEMTILGITPIIPADNDVELGINRVGELINSKRLKIAKSCKNTIDEIGEYHRKELGEEGETKIVKVKDHANDAIRYALLSYPDEEIIVPKEPLKDWEYGSEIERRRERGLAKIREKFALKERFEEYDEELGSDW